MTKQATKPAGDHTSVIIVDDHPAIRDALGHIIDATIDLQLAGTADSADQAFDLLDHHHPHVAVVDLSLGDAHGLDLVQNLRAQYPHLRVVIFSMYDEAVYAERAIRAGASGYVMKSMPTTQVIDAIRAVARGEVFLSRRMASRILSKVALGKAVEPGFDIDTLTDRELTVFQLLGEGYSVAEITDRLKLSRKTVETYRRRAKEKLGLGSIAELLQYAIRWTTRQGHGQHA